MGRIHLNVAFLPCPALGRDRGRQAGKRQLSVFFNLYPAGRLIIDGGYVKKKVHTLSGQIKAFTFLTGFTKRVV
jgi:hypothetical protein